jgi:hypothetical protein
VVSVTDPYGRILGFLDRSRYFYFLLHNIYKFSSYLTTGPKGLSTFFYITYINPVRISQETQYMSVL